MKLSRDFTITILAFSIVGILAVIALNISFLDPVSKVIEDFSYTDVYYQILQETDDAEENEDIVIVDMSELYDRRDLAEAVHEIEEATPKMIGVDVVFEGLKEDTIGDNLLRGLAGRYDNMVFSYRMIDYQNDTIGFTKTVHSFFAEETNVMEGYTNIQRELYGGMKRTLSLQQKCLGEYVPSFISQIAGIGEKNGRTDCLNINFTPTRFRVISPDVIRKNQKLLKDKVVLFGAMTDETDMHYTPLGKMSGVELLAYSLQTITDKNEVWEMPAWMKAVLSFFVAFLTQMGFTAYSSFAGTRRNRFLRFALSSSFTKGLLVFFWLLFIAWASFVVFFKYGVSVSLGWALAAIAFLDLDRNVYNEFTELIKTK